MSGWRTKRTKAPRVSPGGLGNHRRARWWCLVRGAKWDMLPRTPLAEQFAALCRGPLTCHHQEGTWTV